MIEKILDGKQEALEEFYNCYGKMIFSTAFWVCRNHEDSEEVMDNVLIKVWNSAESLVNTDNLEGWLYTVTINAAKDKIRHKDDWVQLNETHAVDQPEFQNILEEESFNALIKNLTEVEQTIFWHRFVNGLTLKHTSEMMNKSKSYVVYNYYKAIEKVKLKLGRQLTT